MSKNIDNQEILKNNQLQQEIDFLRNKISELENEKEINNNNNNNEIKYQEMQKQIFSLKNEKDELQNKLMNYINSEMNNNKKINKILQEKNVLIIENEKLKNEIKELDNENHKNMLQLTKVSEFQKEYEIIKKENETNFEELKIKNEENEKLSNIILEKERENEQLKLQLANKMENMDEDYDNDILNVGRNNELQEKNNTIEKLERQINSMKNTNEKITMENLELKEKIQLFTSSKEEGFSNVLDNLKEELKDKNMQLQKLIEENKNLKNNRYKSNSNIHNINNEINDEDEKEIDLNNRDKNENNPFNNRITINSQGLTDADKIKLYKDRIKELQLVNESDIIQIKTLKDDIKAMKAKIRNLETFGGQIKDMNEFIYLLNQVLINYKPKKQEQKDALNKIVNALNNFQGIN
jgi:spindle assembly abnormal protein 6